MPRAGRSRPPRPQGAVAPARAGATLRGVRFPVTLALGPAALARMARARGSVPSRAEGEPARSGDGA